MSEATPSLQARIDQAVALLRRISADHAPAIIANSFGAEDMVLADMVSRHGIAIGQFTLDTGRLPGETYTLMQETRERYPANPVVVFFPRAESIEHYANEHGINAFYQSVELRKVCCHLRKIEPLARALAGKSAWVTGLRHAQSTTRTDVHEEEWDAANSLTKFSPLLDWSEQDVWAYIRTFDVPYNALHDRQYPSIGCAPCTRAITVGEDIRAGRWWWENPENKECGLHAKASAI